MVYRVLIIGSGQLGSRYLQGLADVALPMDIWVCDPSATALNVASKRWSEVAMVMSGHAVHFIQNPEEIPQVLDLTIVATSADVRAQVVKSIFEKEIFSKYWILEKVLAQSYQDLKILRNCLASTKGAWVNTHFRTIDCFKKIKRSLTRPEKLYMELDGGRWGLACNSIHYLDLFSWMSSSSLNSISSVGLNKSWVEAKRSGFWEVFGSLQASFSNGGNMSLICADSDSPTILKISDGNTEWVIDDSNQVATCSDGLIIDAAIPLQSQRTAAVVHAILQNGVSQLPTLEESYLLHKGYLNCLIPHWNNGMQNFVESVPIT